MIKKQWQYLLLLPALLLVLSGCGSSSDDDDEEDLSAQCPDTSTITDADEVLTEIVYTALTESPDAGDTVGTATSTEKNEIVTGSLTGGGAIDRYDYYSFDVTAGDELEIGLAGDTGTNFDIVLFNTTGTAYIADSLGSTSFDKISYTVESGITSLTVSVETANTSTSNAGNYTLTITSLTDATPITPSTSELNGKISDSASGNVLQGASIQLRACGEKTGDVLASDTSDTNGNYKIDIATGTYTAEVSLDGYTSEFTTIALTADEDSIKNFPLNEQLAAGETRIVLSWGASPSDLDSHLQVPRASPNTGTTEISYQNRSEEGAALDIDDGGGFGPETITISTANTGTYTYWVQDYTNKGSSTSTALANSGAEVKVYNEDGLAKTFTIPSGAGDKWNVFTMNGETGVITAVNTIE